MIQRFWLFHCGYARVPRAALIDSGGWKIVRLPFLCGIAEHSDFGPILLDAPYGQEGPANMGNFMGSLLQRAGLVFFDRWSVMARVEEVGLRVADIGHILMTHLHYDHTGAMKCLAHARFHVARHEWDFAGSDSNRRSSLRGYARTDFLALRDQMELHDSVPHLADSEKGLDLFGDGSIEMFSLPGHTPGHCGYRIHLESGETIFFIGDAVFNAPQIHGEQELGFFPRTIASSMGGVRTSIRALQKHLLRHPDDVVVPCHDLALGARAIDEGPIVFGMP